MACKVFFVLIIVFCLVSASKAKEACKSHKVTAGCKLLSDKAGTSQITGFVHFTQTIGCHHMSPVSVRIRAKGFTADGYRQHGVHIHQLPVKGSSCASAGGHYNPFKRNHAGRLQPKKGSSPYYLKRHVGDLGNVYEVRNTINTRFNDRMISLAKRDGPRNIIGRSFVIHAKRDDLGKGGDAGSLASGNAGARMACCTIRKRFHPKHSGHYDS